MRKVQKFAAFTLGAGGQNQSEAASTLTFLIPDDGNFWVQAIIDGGTFTTAPTDLPVGSWQLWIAADDSTPYVRFTPAESGTYSLASLAPSGNVLINQLASFEKVPGGRGKLVYARTSGGTAARATIIVPRVS